MSRIIELKEDSPEKLAAAQGKPTKNFLFASEINALQDKVEAIDFLRKRATTWNAGIYDVPTIVSVGNKLYVSNEVATYPFTSSDFEAERQSGIWVEVVPDISGKLDKISSVTTKEQVYVKNANGTQGMMNLPDGKFCYQIWGCHFFRSSTNFYTHDIFPLYHKFNYDTGVSNRSLLVPDLYSIFFITPRNCILKEIILYTNQSTMEISIWKSNVDYSATNSVEILNHYTTGFNILLGGLNIPIEEKKGIHLFIKGGGINGTSYMRLALIFE